MEKGINNSGGSSNGSNTIGGVVGSTTAPQAYGIQFMPQPQSAPAPLPNLSQGTFLSLLLHRCRVQCSILIPESVHPATNHGL